MAAALARCWFNNMLPFLNKAFGEYKQNIVGGTAVEFAFVGPLILMLIFGVFYFGIFFFGTHQAQRASEHAARSIRMMDNPTETEIMAELNSKLGRPISGTYTPFVQRIDEHGRTFANVKVTYEFAMPLPYVDRYPMRTETGTRILLRDFQ